MSALAAIIRRDIALSWRIGGGAAIGVLFFLSVVVLMPFAVGPDLALLARLGPAILWLGALLASLLTLDRLFMADHEDGSLDLILMSRTSLEFTCAAKALAHWLAAGLPLVIATPVLGLLLNLDMTATAPIEARAAAPPGRAQAASASASTRFRPPMCSRARGSLWTRRTSGSTSSTTARRSPSARI